MKKNILITGAAGFLGFHTAKSYLEEKECVCLLDNFNSYYDVSLKEERAHLLATLGTSVDRIDIAEKGAFLSYLDKKKPTHIIHLAAQAGVRHSLIDRDPYISSNLLGFLHLLEWCKDHREVPLIFASSSSVYGKECRIPFIESYAAETPESFYAATKRCDEILAATYHNLYQIPITALRFFTVYGPLGRPDMAYFSFAEKIQKGEEIEVYGKGKLVRDFTYVDDVVFGIKQAVTKSFPWEIINLGNNKPRTVMDLIALLEKHLGKQALIKFSPMQKGDVPITYADIEKAKKLLDFDPKTSLEEGISLFIQWFLLRGNYAIS